jgi:hypothetical protein
MIELVTAAPSQDLTVLATAKQELGVTDGWNDARIAQLIVQASSTIAGYCNRPEGFGLATWRETLRQVWHRECLILRRDLAPSITTLVEDGVTLTATDYFLEGSLVYRLKSDRVVDWSASKIVITYDAGFTLVSDLPAEIERACLTTVQALFSAVARDPMIRSESAEGVGARSYLDPRAGMEALPPQAAGMLSAWRRLSV